MKRILFFIHYNQYNKLSDYVVYLLKNVKHIYKRLIFITNSSISENDLLRIKSLYDSIIFRDNQGFDFGAWKEAILNEGWDKLSEYDNLTIMNDTCFGPLFDLESIYIMDEIRKTDFWGMSIYPKSKHGMPGSNKSIPEHIQSYFMCFNNNVIQSKVFHSFWNNVKYIEDVNKIIKNYETKLTQILSNNGFYYIDLLSFNNKKYLSDTNYAHFLPNVIIKNNIPFLKIKAFVYNQNSELIFNLLKKKTNYPIELINNHLNNILNPSQTIQKLNKYISPVNSNSNDISIKVAIHLHVFYIDIFEMYLKYLNSISITFDLFITTDTTDKELQIQKCLENSKILNHLKQIIIIENIGRDILPWLTISNILNKYDIVGHFHTKKSIHLNDNFENTWLLDILENLLSPINFIMKTFQDNSDIGIVIPDISSVFRLDTYIHYKDKKDLKSLNNIWKKLNCQKYLDFKLLDTIIMSYGNMFWYRPNALNALFNYGYSNFNFPPEPISNNSTLAHLLERLPVYIAWNEGYDYKIITSNKYDSNSFIYNAQINKLYNEITKSKSYRLGELFVAPLRYMKRKIKSLI